MNAAAPHGATCDYCGFPLRPAAQRDAMGTRRYCCFGCRFAAAVAEEGGEVGQHRWTLARLGLAIFCTMNVMVFTMALWAQDVYGPTAGQAAATAASLTELFRYACFFFSAPVLILLGKPLLDEAGTNLRRGTITIDWLLALGVFASFVYSCGSLWQGGPHVYFEVGCVVLVAVTLGRWLEATGRLKTTHALLRLQRLLPAEVQVSRSGRVETVPLSGLVVGDQVVVPPGQRIPIDGQIVRNQASIDQQLITGESQPVCKMVGDAVLAGSLNLDGDLLIRVTAPPEHGTMQRLLAAIQAAVGNKGREQRLADRITAWFTPLLVVLTIIAFAMHAERAGFQAGLMSALATVLIACPCALGIATPMAVWAALGRASAEQVLFRDGDALSRLARVTHIGLDKTGTLTTGEPRVRRVEIDPAIGAEAIGTAVRTLTASSDHVVARAIHDHFRQEATVDHVDVTTVPGCGLRGAVPGIGDPVYLGHDRFLLSMGLTVPAALARMIDSCRDNEHMYSCVGWGGCMRGVIVLQEEVRCEAAQAIGALRDLGLGLTVLTGDHRQRGARIGRELGVPVCSELLPDGKLRAIEDWQARGQVTAMVGDGINDAGAMAAASVGIAMGCGADITRDSADVCLLGNDLRKVAWAVGLARKTVRIVRQNLFWAFGYNVIGLALAMANLLNPMVAAAAMVLSSLFVISNSLRLSGGESAERTRQELGGARSAVAVACPVPSSL